MRITCLVLLEMLLLNGTPPSATPTSRPTGTSPASSTKPVHTPTLTILTFNVNYANRDVTKVAELIRQSKADVVCLQETSRLLERGLSMKLRADYPYVRFRGDQGRYGAERFGFLSKRPLSKFRWLPAQHGIFGTWSTEVQFDGRRVQLVNVHLMPLRLTKARGLRDTWRIYRSAEKIHKQEIDRIYAWIRKDIPTVIAGDFNSLSTFTAPAFLRENGLTDSFAAITTDPDLHSTWKWELSGRSLAARIDYLFYSPHLTTTRSRIIEEDKSDHDPLVSTLTWSEEAGEATASQPAAAP